MGRSFRNGRTVPFCESIWKPRNAPQLLDFVGGLRHNAEHRAISRQSGQQLDRMLGADSSEIASVEGEHRRYWDVDVSNDGLKDGIDETHWLSALGRCHCPSVGPTPIRRIINQQRIPARHQGIEAGHDVSSSGKASVHRLIEHWPRHDYDYTERFQPLLQFQSVRVTTVALIVQCEEKARINQQASVGGAHGSPRSSADSPLAPWPSHGAVLRRPFK